MFFTGKIISDFLLLPTMGNAQQTGALKACVICTVANDLQRICMRFYLLKQKKGRRRLINNFNQWEKKMKCLEIVSANAELHT